MPGPLLSLLRFQLSKVMAVDLLLLFYLQRKRKAMHAKEQKRKAKHAKKKNRKAKRAKEKKRKVKHAKEKSEACNREKEKSVKTNLPTLSLQTRVHIGYTLRHWSCAGHQKMHQALSAAACGAKIFCTRCS